MPAIASDPSPLDGLAHEINVRLQKADDHRLSASLKLAEAKEACRAAGVSFKAWVASEIKGIGYPEATKLAKIGAAPDPAKALADYRQKTVRQVREHRAERVAYVSNSLPAIALSRPSRGREAIAGRVREAIAALAGLPPPHEVVGFIMGTDGAVIVDEHIDAAARWLADFNEIWRSHAEAAE